MTVKGDDEDDAMASLRMLYVMLSKLREDLQGSSSPRNCARIPRLSPTLAEAERPLNQNNCNRHDACRINRPVFDSLLPVCAPYITETVRSQRELLGVTLDWMATGLSARAQENTFKIAYSTCHKYRLLALYAIDGVHFQGEAAEEDADRFRSRKGVTTTNVLIASDMNLRVAFVNAGVEGSAHDSSVLSFSGFLTKIPTDYFVLADAGYALTTHVLTPNQGVRCHLQEWWPSHKHPQNYSELFNLIHSKARNAVERLIGVLKRRFRVLRQVNECELVVVKATILACCCLHNVIRQIYAMDAGEAFAAVPEQHEEQNIIPIDFETGTSWRDTWQIKC
ncbi:DDE superfamily endonuclease [Phytophthora infestans]|uniref:DDE superfamily endonuclease n=1 Tax=Phytophthora infestans TaxID=4787 RepID=A0A833SU34_PHYIN|nr:DDE superfamily endonuclease [Phytophthora infestans]KAF4150354.1 DDE superfamily endonuclease [Phytophthora infestans]